MSLGKKYNVESELSKTDILTTIKDVESNLKNLDLHNDVKNEIRENLTSVTSNNHKRSVHISHQEKLFSTNLTKTKSYLKHNPNIFFTHADKGNLTICINVLDYQNKMVDLLKDNNTYKLVNKNPLPKLQSDVYKILSHLNNNDYLQTRYHNNQLT